MSHPAIVFITKSLLAYTQCFLSDSASTCWTVWLQWIWLLPGVARAWQKMPAWYNRWHYAALNTTPSQCLDISAIKLQEDNALLEPVWRAANGEANSAGSSFFVRDDLLYHRQSPPDCHDNLHNLKLLVCQHNVTKMWSASLTAFHWQVTRARTRWRIGS